MPLGYSSQALQHRTPKFPEDIKSWLGNRRFILHSGRTDPMKNAERAVSAFVLATEQDPDLQDVCLLIRSNPNRLYIEANHVYFQRLKKAVTKANEKFGEERIKLISENDVDATIACATEANLLMFNSTIDGQNLTVFEGSLVNKHNAPIILSERCGAAEVLNDVCTIINPFDLAEQAEAIINLLKLDETTLEQKAKKRREVAKRYDLPSWVKMQLNSLQ